MNIARRLLIEQRAPSRALRDIPGLQLWFDATALTGFADGTTIGLWPDLSGHGWDAVQSNESRKPVYAATIINGRPGVQFDGMDDFLSLPAGAMNLARNSPGVSMYAAVRSGASGAQRTMLFISAGSSVGASRAVLLRTGAGAAGASGRRLDADAVQVVSGGSVGAGASHIMTGILNYAGGTASVYLDGPAVVAPTTAFQTPGMSSDSPSVAINVGCTSSAQFANDALGELLVWNRAHSPTETAMVQRYLSRKWGVVVS